MVENRWDISKESLNHFNRFTIVSFRYSKMIRIQMSHVLVSIGYV